MKPSPLLVAATLAVLAGCATTAIDDRDFSLRKAGVSEVVSPAPFQLGSAKREPAPLPGSGMPPTIDHAIDDYLPIKLGKNDCLDCHDEPARIGQARNKDDATPMPRDHYAKAADGKLRVAGTQYNCLACHAPQADVAPLVANRGR